MKIIKNSKTIATTAKLTSGKNTKGVLIDQQIVKEGLEIMSVISIIGFYLKCCLAMAEPIFLQKGLICSFIILTVMFFKKCNTRN